MCKKTTLLAMIVLIVMTMFSITGCKAINDKKVLDEAVELAESENVTDWMKAIRKLDTISNKENVEEYINSLEQNIHSETKKLFNLESDDTDEYTQAIIVIKFLEKRDGYGPYTEEISKLEEDRASLVIVKPKETEKPKVNNAKTSVSTGSMDNIKSKIREYAKYEWDDDIEMVEYEYNKQLSSYKYYCTLPDSKIKEYAFNEWKKGNGFVDWCMVEYEYDKQLSSYNYMKGISDSGKQSAINKWTSGGYTDWCMVEYEYRN